jgi:aryl-alcohol dehydrogenase-like predicted oxidoreductase
MNGCAKLGLGTVQWGMAYGIANRTGQPKGEEVAGLLQLARLHHIDLLDTACTYGEAETQLGNQGHVLQGIKIVTKTPPIKSGQIANDDIDQVLAAFAESLRRLRCQQVYGLMVHHADNLLLPGAERLWAALNNIKKQGLAVKIGVSVYHPAQLAQILNRHEIDLVQLPLNIYDQRFAQTGLLGKLKKLGVEVHARSAFLQGLLLLPPERLPPHFHSIRPHHEQLYRCAMESALSPRDACLHFCLNRTDIDRVVVGCETKEQLSEIISAAKQPEKSLSWAESFAINDEAIINPSMWPG